MNLQRALEKIEQFRCNDPRALDLLEEAAETMAAYIAAHIDDAEPPAAYLFTGVGHYATQLCDSANERASASPTLRFRFRSDRFMFRDRPRA